MANMSSKMARSPGGSSQNQVPTHLQQSVKSLGSASYRRVYP